MLFIVCERLYLGYARHFVEACLRVCAASASIFTSVKEVGSFDVLLYLAFKGLLVSPCLFPGQLIHVLCVRVYGIYMCAVCRPP